MSSTHSVTRWLEQFKAGDQQAAKKLWDRYSGQLVRLARGKLRGARRRAEDEEDVALNALNSFFRGAAAGRFPDLHDRDGLWPLLVAITARKAIKLRQYENRKKRGGGKVRGDSALPGGKKNSAEPVGWDQIVGHEPTPFFACQMADACHHLLEQLPEEALRQVALWKLEEYSNAEIAAKLGCIERTVERKLARIRRIWEKVGA
ncbi:MAG TPA: ECF-type sigma factor [Gemmataceae bacterium]|nr:ECF-type sigma factor [Gemmataceae bacterium]